MAKPRDDRQKDLLRPALEDIIDLGHPLMRLAREIDWGFLDSRFASVCTPGAGQPPLPTRLVAGLLILKHMHDLSDEALCLRWLENPYYQFFCGEVSFCHKLPFDRSSLTHWRQRLGEEQLVALIQESLSVAHKTGALTTRDLERVVVDTTVQPKAIAHPTDARLCHRALEKLVDLAQRHGVPLRQSYRRVAKRAAIMIGRYSHAHQFKRARRELKFLRIRLGRVIRDIRRKIAGNERLEKRFADLLALAVRVRFQDHRQRGPKVYALHAPEVECIGKGKARAPYEFGCKSLPLRRQGSRSPRRRPSPKAASLCCTPRRYTVTRSTVTPWGRSSPNWSSRPASSLAASMSTRAIAATITRRSSGSGSAARCAASRSRSAARCAAAPPSSRSSVTPRPSTAWAAII
jgi:IS5 family transposase